MVLHAGYCSSSQSQCGLHVSTLCCMRCTVRPLDVPLCFKTTSQHKAAHLSQLLVDLIYSKPTEKTSVNIFPLETIMFICAIWARQHIFSSFSFLLSKRWHSLVQFLGQRVNSLDYYQTKLVAVKLVMKIYFHILMLLGFLFCIMCETFLVINLLQNLGFPSNLYLSHQKSITWVIWSWRDMID